MNRKLLSFLLIALIIGSLSIGYVVYNGKQDEKTKNSISKTPSTTLDTSKETTPSSPSNTNTSSNTNSNSNNATNNNTNTSNTNINTNTNAGGSTSSPSKALTKEDAESLAEKVAKSKFQSPSISYDRDEEQNGKFFYVYRVFNNMNDHIATLAWYYVEKGTNNIYELDIASNELKPIIP